MKKPRLFRKRCRVCGAAFSGKRPATVAVLLAEHDCRAEQEKRERAVASKQAFDSIMQGAMLGILGRFLAAGLPPTDKSGAFILPPPKPGGKRTKNPLFGGHGKSTARPVEKGRRKPPSE